MSEPTNPETRTCPDCAEEILKDANVCKHCGYRFRDNPRRQANKGVAVALAVIAVVGGWYWWSTKDSKERGKAIAECIIDGGTYETCK